MNNAVLASLVVQLNVERSPLLFWHSASTSRIADSFLSKSFSSFLVCASFSSASVEESSFFKSLRTAVVALNSACTVTYEERQTPEKDIEFVNAIFLECTSDKWGGGLFCSGPFHVVIFGCVFRFCYSSADCGALFIVKCSYDLGKTLFEECFTQKLDNNQGGNAFGSTDSENDIRDISIVQCSPYNDVAGDASYSIHSAIVKMTRSNFSDCFELSGGLYGELLGVPEGSCSSFVTASGGLGNNIIASWNDHFVLDCFAMHNISLRANSFWSRSGIIVCKNGVIAGCTKRGNAGKVDFINCTSDNQLLSCTPIAGTSNKVTPECLVFLTKTFTCSLPTISMSKVLILAFLFHFCF